VRFPLSSSSIVDHRFGNTYLHCRKTPTPPSLEQNTQLTPNADTNVSSNSAKAPLKSTNPPFACLSIQHFHKAIESPHHDTTTIPGTNFSSRHGCDGGFVRWNLQKGIFDAWGVSLLLPTIPFLESASWFSWPLEWISWDVVLVPRLETGKWCGWCKS
jgi:hypothetical protein